MHGYGGYASSLLFRGIIAELRQKFHLSQCSNLASHLSRFRLGKGYHVTGMIHRSALSDVIGERLSWLGILGQIELVDGDLLGLYSLVRLMRHHKLKSLQSRHPEFCRNLLATSRFSPAKPPASAPTMLWKLCGSPTPGPLLRGFLLRNVRKNLGGETVRNQPLLHRRSAR